MNETMEQWEVLENENDLQYLLDEWLPLPKYVNESGDKY